MKTIVDQLHSTGTGGIDKDGNPNTMLTFERALAIFRVLERNFKNGDHDQNFKDSEGDFITTKKPKKKPSVIFILMKVLSERS